MHLPVAQVSLQACAGIDADAKPVAGFSGGGCAALGGGMDGASQRGAVPAAPAGRAAATASPSLSAVVEDAETAPDPKAEGRREAQRLRREAETGTAIRAGLSDLEGWISDQLRGGLTGLVANLQLRCRQVAARMVDARMGALAARLDDLPARIQMLPAALRVDALVAELGNLVLMSRAWGDGSAPDPGLRRQIATTEARDALLADPSALRVTALWSVCATRDVTCARHWPRSLVRPRP